jgi:hypothetical protein
LGVSRKIEDPRLVEVLSQFLAGSHSVVQVRERHGHHDCKSSKVEDFKLGASKLAENDEFVYDQVINCHIRILVTVGVLVAEHF